jgi:hypothetical protein
MLPVASVVFPPVIFPTVIFPAIVALSVCAMADVISIGPVAARVMAPARMAMIANIVIFFMTK